MCWVSCLARAVMTAILLVVGLVTPPHAMAQAAQDQNQERKDQRNSEPLDRPHPSRAQFDAHVLGLFAEAKYAQAAELLDEALEQQPSDIILLYNAACAYSRLGELDQAADLLFRAVEHGFLDFDHIERDADLEGLREHKTYIEILGIRDEAYDKIAQRHLDAARKQFGEEHYRYEADLDRRICYITALDETAHAEMRAMLERQADFLSRKLFGASPHYFTTIIVPTPDDARRIISNPVMGGLYEHIHRRIIAIDIGLMLRHEFVHLMHYGHMERLAQPHALWVQEGLAALYESYIETANGGVRVVANQRHNLVLQLIRDRAVPRWRDMFSWDQDRFMNEARATYPIVRSIFRYLDALNKLDVWYQHYIDTFDEDATGVLAFERTFDATLEEVESHWRRWARNQPPVDDIVGRGDASLGVQYVEKGSNDGVLIEAVLHNSAAALAGIRPGDVIVSVDGQTTRSHFELLTIIGQKRVGEIVKVRLRRGIEYNTFDVRLKALGSR